jgi:hypothetical protein
MLMLYSPAGTSVKQTGTGSSKSGSISEMVVSVSENVPAVLLTLTAPPAMPYSGLLAQGIPVDVVIQQDADLGRPGRGRGRDRGRERGRRRSRGRRLRRRAADSQHQFVPYNERAVIIQLRVQAAQLVDAHPIQELDPQYSYPRAGRCR